MLGLVGNYGILTGRSRIGGSDHILGRSPRSQKGWHVSDALCYSYSPAPPSDPRTLVQLKRQLAKAAFPALPALR